MSGDSAMPATSKVEVFAVQRPRGYSAEEKQQLVEDWNRSSMAIISSTGHERAQRRPLTWQVMKPSVLRVCTATHGSHSWLW
jgi:hypothetical protein